MDVFYLKLQQAIMEQLQLHQQALNRHVCLATISLWPQGPRHQPNSAIPVLSAAAPASLIPK